MQKVAGNTRSCQKVADWWTALTSDKGQKILLTTDKTRKKNEPTVSIFAFIKKRNQCTFFLA